MPQNTNQELLQRFVDAQDHGYEFGETYAKALDEMKQGQKMTHWIWYVFPQIQGLGKSFIAVYFSIYDLEEAVAYYQHPILGARLREIINLREHYPDLFRRALALEDNERVNLKTVQGLGRNYSWRERFGKEFI